MYILPNDKDYIPCLKIAKDGMIKFIKASGGKASISEIIYHFGWTQSSATMEAVRSHLAEGNISRLDGPEGIFTLSE